jgi:S1-C subfamily serine protease
MTLMHSWSHARVPGVARRLLLVVLAALASVVAASPAGAAGHSARAPKPSPNRGIVDIYTALGYEQAAAAGTGMILTRSGEVLTNNHVIRGATHFRVVDVTTHKAYQASVVGYSVTKDVAVLQLVNASGLKTIPLGHSALVHTGQKVVARGNALGRGGAPRVAAGKVIALHRKIVATDGAIGDSEQLVDLIETNAHVQPGDSGGPLENALGRAVGMVTAGSSGLGSRGFAIPIDHALALARQIVAGKPSLVVHIGATAFLGIGVQDENGSGAGVTSVVTGSAAETAGLAQGDVITSLNGTTITDSADVRTVVLSLTPGTPVAIGWTDTSGTAQTGTITPASGPPQ